MREIAGTARVIESGFDTDTMMRWAVLEFDPPVLGMTRKRLNYTSITDDGLPSPMGDDDEQAFFKRYARWLGYELVE